MDRQEFLQKHWQPYPVLPATATVFGQVLRIDDKAQKLFLSTLFTPSNSAGETQPAVIDGQGCSFFSILQKGDWVAANAQQIWLLAPRLSQVERLTSETFNNDCSHDLPNRELLQKFADHMQQLRDFFRTRGFLEAFTPTLVPCPGTEPYIEPFRTEFVQGTKRWSVYLPTSPELHLKKMLAQGMGPLFEIKSSFRNGEVSEHHEPEFLMLEWYRPFAQLSVIENDLFELIKSLCHNPDLPCARVSVRELFATHCDFLLTPQTTHSEFAALAQRWQIPIAPDDAIDDLFHRILLQKIEPFFNPELPLVIYDYPPFLGAYARLNPQGWADRFEFYWQGMELANAFHEINDPQLQRQRMQQDLQKKSQLQRQSVPLDEGFFQALQSGMPPSSGIAVGVERLFMAVHGIKKLQELRLFPWTH